MIVGGVDLCAVELLTQNYVTSICDVAENPDSGVRVTAGLFRRDVFDLEAELSKFQGLFSPQLNEAASGVLFVERPLHPPSHDQADIDAYLSEWIPQLMALARVEFIDRWLFESKDDRATLSTLHSAGLCPGQPPPRTIIG